MSKKRIIIIAGESSGDFHSASLIQALKRINPDIEISGVGGERMRQAGAEISSDLAELSIIGFTDVLKNIVKIKRTFNNLLATIDAQPPDAVILVDYPGFNLKLAKAIKQRQIPVIYYISPQIWAWWKGRIKSIKRFVDKMIVVFKFEESIYRDYGIDVSFVGHPLLDMAHPTTSREDFLNKLGLSAQKPFIGMVPGSRKMEITRILPILLESAKIIKQRLPEAQFALLKAPALSWDIFNSILKKYAQPNKLGNYNKNVVCRFISTNLPITICENQTYDFLQSCDFALVASGTATLEAAIMQTPMAVVYKVSLLNWLIAKPLIRLPFIGLVNVVAAQKIVPEFIQYQAKPQLIAAAALEALNNQEKLAKIKSELQKVRQGLGSPGASLRAAELVLNLIS